MSEPEIQHLPVLWEYDHQQIIGRATVTTQGGAWSATVQFLDDPRIAVLAEVRQFRLSGVVQGEALVALSLGAVPTNEGLEGGY